MYSTGSLLPAVPVRPIALTAASRRSPGVALVPRRQLADYIGESYVSEYVGDYGATIPTEYIGSSDYELVVGDAGPYIGEVVLPRIHRRRAVRAMYVGEYDKLEGLSFKGIAKAVKKVAAPVQKAATKVGHAVGTAVTSKIGQAVIGGALALTGVGLPAAAALGAAARAGGEAIKPGGNLKRVATGAAKGAAVGAASSIAGKVVRAGITKFTGPKQIPATTGGTTLDRLASGEVPGVSTLPTSAIEPGGFVRDLANAPTSVLTAAPVAAIVTTAAAKRVLAPKVPKNAGDWKPGAPAPKGYRVESAGTANERLVSDATNVAKKISVAQKVLNVGTAAKKVADSAAQKARQLAAAAQKAKDAGDALGFNQLSDAAERVRQQTEAAEAAATATGNAAQGASQGAVTGSGLGAVTDFIENHKPLVYGGLALVAAIIVVPRLLPSRSPAPRAA